MRPTLLQRADLSGEALDELKRWLGITQSHEDAMLIRLLEASTELCAAFIRQFPLEVSVEERVGTEPGCYTLTARPARAILAVHVLELDATTSPLAALAYRGSITPDGSAQLDLLERVDGQAITVQMIAGLANDWASLPRALRQGIIRLAAFYYGARDSEEPPPPSVTALWRPWRELRLA